MCFHPSSRWMCSKKREIEATWRETRAFSRFIGEIIALTEITNCCDRHIVELIESEDRQTDTFVKSII